MSIAWRDGVFSNVDSSTTLTITVPATVQAGDVVLIVSNCVVLSLTPATVTASSTATTPAQFAVQTATQTVTPGSVTSTLWAFTASGSDASATITLTSTATSYWAAALGAWSGAQLPLDVYSGTANQNQANITCPTLSTSVNDDWVVCLAGGASEASVLTIPAGLTSRETGRSGSFMTAVIADGNGSAGLAGTSIGGGQFTSTGASNGGTPNLLAAFTVGLAPVRPGFRLFPTTGGPNTPISYTGPFISGVVFATVGGAGCWLDGYWWWVCASGQSTSAVECALWTVGGGSGAGQVVPGSVVTSGTLTAGQWNFIPLTTPVQLATSYATATPLSGSAYIAAIGCNGNFPDTSSFWGSGGPGGSGIQNGPLFAYAGSGGSPNAPWTLPQGVFSVGGTDPSTTMPVSQSGTDNFWVDVQISTDTPYGYAGSYRLWPNKQDANNVTTGDAAFNYTIATEVWLSEACTLNNVWYFSPSGATTLATRCDVWNIATGTSVATISSPTWLDTFNASFTAGNHVTGTVGTWIKAAFPSRTVLPPGKYRVSVFSSVGTSDANWSPKDASTDYFGQTFQGAGAFGITWGPISAPNYAGSAPGFVYNAGNGGASPPFSGGASPNAQPPFGQNPGGTIQFPQIYAAVGVGTNQTQVYWVDLEVTPGPATPVIVDVSMPSSGSW